MLSFPKSFPLSISYLKSIINKGDSRSVNAKKNILTSFLIRGGSIVVSLILLPLTIHYVNPTQYGIWLTLGSIIGWFGFFDIGFGNGLRNKFAEALAKGQHKLARIYISTTYAILSIIISVVLILFLCINPFLNWAKILNAPSGMIGELTRLSYIFFIFFCLQFVFQLLTTIITARQEPAKASLINFLGSLFSLTIIYILTKTTSGNLIYLGMTLSLVPVIVLIVSSIWFYTHEYKKYAPSYKFVRFRFARGLMGLGLKFFIIQIAFVIIYQTDTIVIAQLFGPAQVTPYNIAFKYLNIIPMVFSIIITPFWSAFTEAYIKKEYSWINTTIKKLVRIWILFTLIVVVMLIASNLVYSLWIGSSVKVPFALSATIAFYIILNTWCTIFSIFLNGVGKLKLQLYSALFGALINIPLSILLGKQFGISGVLLSICLLAMISAIWSPIQYYKIINNKASGIWNK